MHRIALILGLVAAVLLVSCDQSHRVYLPLERKWQAGAAHHGTDRRHRPRAGEYETLRWLGQRPSSGAIRLTGTRAREGRH